MFWPGAPAALSQEGLAKCLSFALRYLHTLVEFHPGSLQVRLAASHSPKRFLNDPLVTELFFKKTERDLPPAPAPAPNPPSINAEFSHLLSKFASLETSIANLVKASASTKKEPSQLCRRSLSSSPPQCGSEHRGLHLARDRPT
jgi:hypothetical protein